jgi:hypothetical protein
VPKIELHARGVVSRPGWDVWGLEGTDLDAFVGVEDAAGRLGVLERERSAVGLPK